MFNCLCKYDWETEEIANQIGKGIQESGVIVEIKDILEVDVTEIQDYDGILLGAYTWGEGDLPDEFLDFYDEMNTLNLSRKNRCCLRLM